MTHWIEKLEEKYNEENAQLIQSALCLSMIAISVFLSNWHLAGIA